ncbi:CapA family protein [Crassaminicella profunda]|uniref:CapA family protein n=1 Tax=Crassaminicella profunda TaxID=1286698 RepID=UPI001CA65EDD|nr:CapA family protein [Crassaminicella profunda]QZY55998.1 CapA family protein [Crassaminicella profunda]
MYHLLKKGLLMFMLLILTTSLSFAEENIATFNKQAQKLENIYYKNLPVPMFLSAEALHYTKNATIQLASVGDIMCHNTQYIAARKNGTYDFSSSFAPIKPYIASADLAIGNLETTFSGAKKKYSNYPAFNTPEQLGLTLKNIGFDILSTANNHSLDKRNYGILHTLDELDKLGIKHTGTFRNKQERDTLLIENMKDIKIAFMSYTYGTNGIPIPKENPFAINLINKEKILEDIQKAKNENVDCMVFSLHLGQEYKRKQNKYQEELVDFLFKNGVDIVLGGHPHVIQPAKIKEVTTIDGEKKKCFVIYSQGNFFADQKKKYTYSGLITLIDITKNFETHKTEIAHISFVPTWVDKSRTKKGLDFRILPVEEAIADYEQKKDPMLNSRDYKRLKEVLVETKAQIF